MGSTSLHSTFESAKSAKQISSAFPEPFTVIAARSEKAGIRVV
jgi:hypothetical protein